MWAGLMIPTYLSLFTVANVNATAASWLTKLTSGSNFAIRLILLIGKFIFCRKIYFTVILIKNKQQIFLSKTIPARYNWNNYVILMFAQLYLLINYRLRASLSTNCRNLINIDDYQVINNIIVSIVKGKF